MSGDETIYAGFVCGIDQARVEFSGSIVVIFQNPMLGVPENHKRIQSWVMADQIDGVFLSCIKLEVVDLPAALQAAAHIISFDEILRVAPSPDDGVQGAETPLGRDDERIDFVP